MTRRALAGAVACVVLLGACGAGEDEFDYHGKMRGIETFADTSDAELDSIAEHACALVATSVDAGETNERALDRVFWAMQESGLSDVDALFAAVTIVGANCPIDISE